jgi:hypothetical protein
VIDVIPATAKYKNKTAHFIFVCFKLLLLLLCSK